MNARRTLSAVFALSAMLATIAGSPVRAATPGTCSTTVRAGGEWTSFGHDLANTRTQRDERTINSSNAASLTPAWNFSIAAARGKGNFQSVPAVAEGCLYVTTSKGYVYALNADTGALVWGKKAVPEVTGICCGGALYSPTVKDGVVYLHVASNPSTSESGDGPYLLALDAATGALKFRSQSVANEPGSFTDASPVIYDGMDLMGISGSEGGAQRPGGFVLIDVDPNNDVADGTVIKRTFTVPDKDFARGYAGGSIWATAVVDTEEGFAYVGTGQPSTAAKEHPNTNAIIKIDLNRNSRRFGEIVDVAKGNQDGHVSGTTDQPVCKANPNIVTCARLDIDFGSSPSLFHDSDGRLIVGELQKGGTYHAVYAETMESAWDTMLSFAHGYENTNISSAAVDGSHVYVLGAPPGELFSLRQDAGGYEWVLPQESAPMQDGPVSTANGLVYTVTRQGFLNIVNASNGTPVSVRQLSLDLGGACASNVVGGVVIARNTIYAQCGDGVFGDGYTAGSRDDGYIVALRLP